MACPACGAPNAASRVACARCAASLHSEQPDEAGTDASSAPAPAAVERPSFVLMTATVLALVAGLGMLAAILSARGVGPLAQETPTDVLSDAEAAEVVDARASSERPPSEDRAYAAENVLDGDTQTAWVADSDGTQWIELELDGLTQVVGLVLWNGYQDGERFALHDRISSLRIVTDEHHFTVDLLDTRGPVAIDFPEPVAASRIRLVGAETFSGDEVEGAALSLVEVRARSGP